MKTKLFLFTSTALIALSCHTSKKTKVSPAVATTEVAPTTTVASSPILVTKPANGIYEPGAEELTAIQLRHKDVTLDKLKQGYVLYAQSACVSCHPAQNIYAYDEMKWQFIIQDMASRAKLTNEQRDAVHKYVLAIKDAKPK